MALWLTKIYRKLAIWEVHGTILSGHDAVKKTYLRLTNAYFWPNVKKDIQAHIDSCLQCQVTSKEKVISQTYSIANSGPT